MKIQTLKVVQSPVVLPQVHLAHSQADADLLKDQLNLFVEKDYGASTFIRLLILAWEEPERIRVASDREITPIMLSEVDWWTKKRCTLI